jgi:chromosome segregation ATPase
MVVKTAKDVEKLQKQMSEQFERHFQAMRSGEGAAMLLEDPEAATEQARANLEAAIRDRDEALRMADLRVERRRKELASLENNLKHAGQQVDEAPEKRKRKSKEHR